MKRRRDQAAKSSLWIVICKPPASVANNARIEFQAQSRVSLRLPQFFGPMGSFGNEEQRKGDVAT